LSVKTVHATWHIYTILSLGIKLNAIQLLYDTTNQLKTIKSVKYNWRPTVCCCGHCESQTQVRSMYTVWMVDLATMFNNSKGVSFYLC